MHFVDDSNSKSKKKKKEHGRRCDAGGSRGTAGEEEAVAAGNKCSRMVTGTPVSHTVPLFTVKKRSNRIFFPRLKGTKVFVRADINT